MRLEKHPDEKVRRCAQIAAKYFHEESENVLSEGEEGLRREYERMKREFQELDAWYSEVLTGDDLSSYAGKIGECVTQFGIVEEALEKLKEGERIGGLPVRSSLATLTGVITGLKGTFELNGGRR